ncbi:MAG: extracellular solute-binding protein [Streptosporangiales bacterium]|nr:extracellular solute-binding protein [Streptosporangiales bacterium]
MSVRLHVISLLAVALLAAACGSPTDSRAQGPDAGSESAYAAVMSKIKGLDERARRDRLVQLAEQESGTFQVYGTLVNDQLKPIMEDFVESTGSGKIKASFYRSGSQGMLERVMQEARAGDPRADAIVTLSTDLRILSDAKLLQRFDSPVTRHLSKDVVAPDWAGVYINAYTLSWNTKLVKAGQVPKTWEDVLNYTAHPIGIEVQSYDWFATMVTRYFMAEKGMTEQQAVAAFTNAKADLVPVNGRSTLGELLSAGEYGLGIGTYTQTIDDAKRDGAPVAWKPPVQPLVQRPNGVAPMAGSDRPATALLFVDYLLSERGQKMIASFSRIPTNQDVPGALPKEYKVLPVNEDEMAANRQKWTDLYSKITGRPAQG